MAKAKPRFSPNGKQSNWREIRDRRRGVVKKALPSGMVIYTKRPRLMNFIYSGAPLPKSLLALVSDGKPVELDIETLDTSMFAEFVDLGGLMMAQCCVEPKVTLDETDDEDVLWVEDIDEEDRFTYFQWASGDADALAGFPEGEEGTDSPAPDGEGIRHAPEPDSGHNG